MSSTQLKHDGESINFETVERSASASKKSLLCSIIFGLDVLLQTVTFVLVVRFVH